jgi:hypothetical protein
VTHPLLGSLLDAAEGRFLPVDGGVTYVAPFAHGIEAVVAFTGHAVIASRLAASDLADLHPDGFGAALAPEVLLRLADGGTVGINDVTLCRRGLGGGTLPETSEWGRHYRVRHARRLRSGVRVFGDDRGLVTLGNGLAGRLEMSVETVDALHDSGVGRAMIAEAIALVPEGEWVFAGVSPGNARSLRAFLSAGFLPIASEVQIVPAEGRDEGVGYWCGRWANSSSARRRQIMVRRCRVFLSRRLTGRW